MKTKFYFLAAVAAALFITVNASAQYRSNTDEQYRKRYEEECRSHGQQAFYYYPQSNLYYSFAKNQYIYLYRNAWVVSNRLPHHMYVHLVKEPRFVVNHYGFDVWNENRFHIAKYRDYRRFQPDVAYYRNNSQDAYHRNDEYDGWKR